MKDLCIGLTISIATFAIALIAGEYVLRLKNSDMSNYDIEMWRYSKELKRASDNPQMGHEHIPSSQAILQSVEIRTNAEGLRGGEVAPKEAGERRILFLGSSITLGWGVEEDKVLTSQLQDKFSNAGQNVSVLNAGIGNYNAVRYSERFLTKLTHLEPTDIVVHYFVNDAEKLGAGGGNWFLRNSQLAVLMWRAFNQVAQPAGETTLLGHYQNVYAEDAEGYQDMRASLTKLVGYAKEQGIKVHFVMMPDIHNLKDYPFHFIHEDMKNFAAKLDVASYLDLLPSFKQFEEDAKAIWAMPGDPHPNAHGHAVMAEALYTHLN